jgi:alpha/beta superfamily hydrolase
MEFYDYLVRKVGVNVLVVAYRGYSKSEGVPSENGIKMDARAIAGFVKNCPEIDKARVFLMGRFFGAAVAL